MNVNDIDLSDSNFWRRPWSEREAAFAVLREERPVAHFEDPVIEGSEIEFQNGSGY